MRFSKIATFIVLLITAGFLFETGGRPTLVEKPASVEKQPIEVVELPNVQNDSCSEQTEPSTLHHRKGCERLEDTRKTLEKLDNIPLPATPTGVEILPQAAFTPWCGLEEQTSVEEIVFKVFVCKLTEAGFAHETAVHAGREALVVADCESDGLNPSIVAFNGRYVNQPHPVTGFRYTARGLFQFIPKTAERFVPGGYASTTDPVLSTIGAAELWITNVNNGYPQWSDWACVWAFDGFATHSVLPGRPGGPAEMPDWVFEYE